MANRQSESGCKERCEAQKINCSCDVRCRIFKSCCTDLQKICPDIHNESLTTFAQTLQLVQECTTTGYLLISECPPDRESRLNLKTDHNVYLRTHQEIVYGRGALSYLLHRVPLSDGKNEFTFKNQSVFLCNNIPGKSLVFWDLYIDAFHLGRHGELSWDELSKLEYAVVPPEEMELIVEKMKCLSQNKIYTRFMHYQYEDAVLRKPIESRCAVCFKEKKTESESKKVKYVLNRDRPSLPIKLSLKNNKFRFISLKNYLGHNKLNWKSLECSISKNKSKEVHACFIEECFEGLVKISPTQCKAKYEIQMAVPADEIPEGVQHLQCLHRFILCFLHTFAGYDIKEKWNHSDIVFDNRQKRIFYVTKFYLFSDDPVLRMDYYQFAKVFHLNFARLIKVLKSRGQHINRNIIINASYISTLKQMVSIDYEETSIYFQEYFNSTPTAESTTTISLCANIVDATTYELSIVLSCIQYPNSNTEDKTISEGNKCLPLLTGNGGHLGSQALMLNIIFCVFGTIGTIFNRMC